MGALTHFTNGDVHCGSKPVRWRCRDFIAVFKERTSIESTLVSEYQPYNPIAPSSSFRTLLLCGRLNSGDGELTKALDALSCVLKQAACHTARPSPLKSLLEEGTAGIVVALKEKTISGPRALARSQCRLYLVMAESNFSHLQSPVASFELTLAPPNYAAPSVAPPTAASPSSNNTAFGPASYVCVALAVPKPYIRRCKLPLCAAVF